MQVSDFDAQIGALQSQILKNRREMEDLEGKIAELKKLVQALDTYRERLTASSDKAASAMTGFAGFFFWIDDLYPTHFF